MIHHHYHDRNQHLYSCIHFCCDSIAHAQRQHLGQQHAGLECTRGTWETAARGSDWSKVTECKIAEKLASAETLKMWLISQTTSRNKVLDRPEHTLFSMKRPESLLWSTLCHYAWQGDRGGEQRQRHCQNHSVHPESSKITGYTEVMLWLKPALTGGLHNPSSIHWPHITYWSWAPC